MFHSSRSSPPASLLAPQPEPWPPTAHGHGWIFNPVTKLALWLAMLSSNVVDEFEYWPVHSVPWPTAPRGALIFSPSIRRPGLWPAATVSMYGETEFNASICQSFRLFPAADANDTTFNHTCSQSAPCSCHFPYWSGYFSVNLKSRCCTAPFKKWNPRPKS